MFTLGIILARAGSKGLPDKCIRPLLGRALLEYAIDHALAAERLDAVILSTDSPAAQELGRRRGVAVIERPAELATDTATVDAAARHAVTVYEQSHCAVDAVVLLYGNIPVRAAGIIDRAVAYLAETGADSVRTLAPVSKQHPDWLHRLDAGDRMVQFRENRIYRRQDLSPLYYHDGAVVAVRRASLLAGGQAGADPHAFFGRDRRGIVQRADATVDVDEEIDLYLAEAILRSRVPADEAIAVEATFIRESQTSAATRRIRSTRLRVAPRRGAV